MKKENKINEGEVMPEKTPWWVWGLMIIFTFSTISGGFRVREVLNTQSIAEVYCDNGNYSKTSLWNGESLYIDCREKGYTGETNFKFDVSSDRSVGTPYGVNSFKDFKILFTLKSEIGNGGKVEATFTPEFDCQKDSMDFIEKSIEENLLFKNSK